MERLFRRGFVLLVFCFLVLVPAGIAVAADDKGADNKALDKKLYEILRDVHNRATDLYNSGDHAGSYRMFQGLLWTVKPLLSHHPELQKEIDDGINKAEEMTLVARRAFALHDLVEKVRAKLKNDGQKAAATLWERLGGDANVKKIVDDFVALAAADPKVNFTRGGKNKPTPEQIVQLKKTLVEFISSATGGPYKYSGKNMKDAHKGMGITDAEFSAAAANLKKALEDNKAKAADVDAILKAVEATRKDIVEPKGSSLP